MERFEELRKKILPVLLPYGVKRIALFGSVVREEDTLESDVDILVKLKPPNERPPLGLLELNEIVDSLVRAIKVQGNP